MRLWSQKKLAYETDVGIEEIDNVINAAASGVTARGEVGIVRVDDIFIHQQNPWKLFSSVRLRIDPCAGFALIDS